MFGCAGRANLEHFPQRNDVARAGAAGEPRQGCAHRGRVGIVSVIYQRCCPAIGQDQRLGCPATGGRRVAREGLFGDVETDARPDTGRKDRRGDIVGPMLPDGIDVRTEIGGKGLDIDTAAGAVADIALNRR